MNYERVLLIIKDRAEEVKSLMGEAEEKMWDEKFKPNQVFFSRALINLKEEFDELNAAYAVLEKLSNTA